MSVSPDHRLLAYTVDTAGDEVYELTVVDVETAEAVDAGLGGLTYGLVWANDNRTLFLVGTDDAQRADHVLRHEVRAGGAPAVVFAEPDERFWVGLGKTRSDRFVVIAAESKTTSECHLVDADDPASPPRLVRARRDGVEYRVDHQGGRLLVVANDDGADDFRLAEAPLEGGAAGEWAAGEWRELLGHRPGVRLEDVDCFETFAVVHERRAGLPRLRLVDLRPPAGGGADESAAWLAAPP
ncbi:MAG TPA: oligopeptidase B, partial [Acidimicrobiaceae bacterium]|nr:oligopeptidase B [Acidimicrobiaceae bacterium]